MYFIHVLSTAYEKILVLISVEIISHILFLLKKNNIIKTHGRPSDHLVIILHFGFIAPSKIEKFIQSHIAQDVDSRFAPIHSFITEISKTLPKKLPLIKNIDG